MMAITSAIYISGGQIFSIAIGLVVNMNNLSVLGRHGIRFYMRYEQIAQEQTYFHMKTQHYPYPKKIYSYFVKALSLCDFLLKHIFPCIGKFLLLCNY